MAIRLARMLGARAAPGTTQEYEAHVFGRMLETLRANVALVGVLALSAFLNLWHLTDNGYGNSYYAAAVRSMTQSWHNFFFASFDPGGFITVDKPPVGLWMQAASAKVFGYSGFTILMPEALAGIGSVFVLYLAVSRVFGKTAGVIAGLVLAITPITVAINRSNNLDAWLIFFTVCAAYAVVRACENASWRWLAVSTLMIGIAFNTKTLAGFVALPPLMFAYAVCAPASIKRRVRDLAIAGVVLAAVSGAWVAAVDLTPASSRPYVGGSTENSELDLLLHYNGIGRIDGDEQGFPGGAPPAGIERPNGAGLPGGLPRPGAGGLPGGQVPGAGNVPGGQLPGGGQRPGAGQLPNGGVPPTNGTLPGGAQLPPFAGGADGAAARPGAAPGGPGGRGFTGGQSGPLRLFNHEISGQASWLLPLALIGGLGALLSVGRRLSGNQRLASIIVWGGWLLTAGVVFSQASGIFHPYYLSYLGPALGGMVGIAAVGFWSAARERSRLAFFAPLALALTAAFELSVLHITPDYKPWLVFALAFPVAIGAIVLVINLGRALQMRWTAAALALALAGVLLPPLVWSSSVIASGVNGALPFVDPAATTERNFGPRRAGRDLPGGATAAAPGSPGEFRVNTGLVSYLEANKGGAKYLVATESSMNAAGIIIDTGEPVMAIGGFSGSDPALTLDQFANLVENGTVRYFLVGGFGGPGAGPLGQGLADLTPEQREYLRQAVIERSGDAADARAGDATADGRGGPAARRAGTRAISQAVAQAGKLVDASAYGGASGGQLYDLQGTAAALRAAGGQ